MVYTFDDANAPSRHKTQYFEITANRALSGWLDRQHYASETSHWQTVGKPPDSNDFPWELYNINKDFSQSKDLSKQQPDKLRDLQARFLVEARKYNVLPLDSSFVERGDPSKRPILFAA